MSEHEGGAMADDRLDAIAEWFEVKTQHSTIDDLSVIPEWQAVRDLIAEVRRLRVDVGNWEAAAKRYSDRLMETMG